MDIRLVAINMADIAEAFNPYDFDLILEEAFGLTTKEEYVVKIVNDIIFRNVEEILELIDFLNESVIEEEDEDYSDTAEEIVKFFEELLS